MQAISNPVNVSQLQKVWAVRAAGSVGAFALLTLVAPYIWSAVAAGMGLAALTAMGVVGVVVFQTLPLGTRRLENHILQLRTEEARRNPIEQLQNELIRRAYKLHAFDGALVSVGGEIESIVSYSKTVKTRTHLTCCSDRNGPCSARMNSRHQPAAISIRAISNKSLALTATVAL